MFSSNPLVLAPQDWTLSEVQEAMEEDTKPYTPTSPVTSPVTVAQPEAPVTSPVQPEAPQPQPVLHLRAEAPKTPGPEAEKPAAMSPPLSSVLCPSYKDPCKH